MNDYPLYDVEDCDDYKSFLEKIYSKYSKQIAFESKSEKWTYEDIYNSVLKCLPYFLKDERKYFGITIENPYIFFVAYFSVVISNNIAILLDKGEISIKQEYIAIDSNLIENLINLNEKDESIWNRLPNTNNTELSTIAQSSGTTSVAKGVMLSQKNLLEDTIAGMRLYEYSKNARYVNILPYYHLFGVVADLLGPLYSGSTICFSDNKLDFFGNLLYFKPTNLNLPPAMVTGIYKVLKQTNNKEIATGGNLKKILCAGAKMDDSLNEEFRKYGFSTYSAYGLTECSPCVTMNRDNLYKTGSCGKVLPCCKVKIVDGEIAVRGTNVMLGYFQDEKSTEKVLRDGWLYTGDLGELDEENFLFLTGRKSNIIVFEDGTKLVPETLEKEIEKINGVSEVLVKKEQIKEKIMLNIIINNQSENNKEMEDKSKIIEEIKKNIKEICKNKNIINRVYKINISNEPLKRNKLGKVIRV